MKKKLEDDFKKESAKKLKAEIQKGDHNPGRPSPPNACCAGVAEKMASATGKAAKQKEKSKAKAREQQSAEAPKATKVHTSCPFSAVLP